MKRMLGRVGAGWPTASCLAAAVIAALAARNSRRVGIRSPSDTTATKKPASAERADSCECGR
jgi:hypothetical protein